MPFKACFNDCNYEVGDIIELKAYKADCYVRKDLNAYIDEAKLEGTINHISLGQTFDAMDYISANDEEDGTLTSSIKVIKNEVDTMHRGFCDVTHQVTDKDGNTSNLTH